MKNINEINFYHFVNELTVEQYNEISFYRSTLVIGKGKNKRYFLSLFTRQNHMAGIEGDAKSKGFTGKFFILHHIGKGKSEIVKEVEI